MDQDRLPNLTAETNDYFHSHEQEKFLKVEKDFVACATGREPNQPWSGIALSGGGVRSATFCLGALQALAAKNLLSEFDYLSSVSGGGYIALSIQWFRSKFGYLQTTNGNSIGLFPFGSAHPDPSNPIGNSSDEQQHNLAFLRNNISYLAPGGGVTVISGLLAVLRTIFLNLVVWVPVATILYLGILVLSYTLASRGYTITSPLPGFPIWSLEDYKNGPAAAGLPLLSAFMIWPLWIYFGVLAFLSFATSLVAKDDSGKLQIIVHILGLISGLLAIRIHSRGSIDSNALDMMGFALISAFGVVSVSLLIVRFLRCWESPQFQLTYFSRRLLETKFTAPFTLLVTLAILGSIPILSVKLHSVAKTGPFGAVGVIFGLSASIYGHYTTLRSYAPGLVGRAYIAIGSALLLVGFALICFDMSFYAFASYLGGSVSGDLPKFQEADIFYIGILLFVVVISTISLIHPNINQISLHRYYRDRLMETFMPGMESLSEGVSGGSPDADKFAVSEIERTLASSKAKHILFPIVNTNCILFRDQKRLTSVRGGASFSITPLYTGSQETGWVKTNLYETGQGPIHVASAMAVSGAAANSNAGYTGVGITRNRILSTAMVLLNLRLGLWLTNPETLASDLRARGPRKWFREMLCSRRPRHLHPGLTYGLGLCGAGYARSSHFVELSDGGHFENLGIYELVRRECELILVCDGEADKETSYAGLVAAARRIQEDFGATIQFRKGLGPERLVPKIDLGYPSNTKGAISPYLVAEIKYKSGKIGAILYLKATMVEDLSFVAKGYKGANPDFPHQSTVDQFFQTDQFEAYRELGYRSTLRCIEELSIKVKFPKPNEILKRYANSQKIV